VIAALATALALATAASAPAGETGDVFVSPSGSDAGRCQRLDPCLTFDRAYHVASQGQIVVVAGGDYPTQVVREDATKSGRADVVFRPASGETVRVHRLETYASHIRFERLVVTGSWGTHAATQDVTFADVQAKSFYIRGSRSIRVVGGSYGPIDDAVAQIKLDYKPPRPSPWAEDILIDGVRFHDFRKRAGDVHMECIHVMNVNGLVIRRSRFERCAIFDVFVKRLAYNGRGTPEPDYGNYSRNIRIENNFFDAPTAGGFYSLRFSGHSDPPIVIRHNSFLAEVSLGTALDFTANIVSRMTAYTCRSFGRAGVVFRDNVYEHGSRCQRSDFVVPDGDVGYRHRRSFDLHLADGSEAVDRGGTDSPHTDIDGQLRPSGPRSDAGADELGTSPGEGKDRGPANADAGSRGRRKAYRGHRRPASAPPPGGRERSREDRRHDGRQGALRRSSAPVGPRAPT
jgi:hypothetical protein